MHNSALTKKGLSSMVASVLLILIVISIAGLLYTYLYGNTLSKIENLSPPCTELTSQTLYRITTAEYNTILEQVVVSISNKDFNNDVTSMGIRTIYHDGTSDYYFCGCQDCVLPSPGIPKTYLINAPTKPVAVELVLNEACTMNKMNVN